MSKKITSTDVTREMLQSGIDIIEKYDKLSVHEWIEHEDEVWNGIIQDTKNAYSSYLNCSTPWAKKFAKNLVTTINGYFEDRQNLTSEYKKKQK